MDDVTEISSHPKFKDRRDPLEMRSRGRDEPIEMGFGLAEEDELDRNAVVPAPTICVNCTSCADLRPFWQRWFRKPRARDLLCVARPLQAMEHPVTGEVTYTNGMFTTPSKGLSHKFDRCQDINLDGHCHAYRNNGGTSGLSLKGLHIS